VRRIEALARIDGKLDVLPRLSLAT